MQPIVFKPEGPPEGTYVCKFLGVQDVDTSKWKESKYGNGNEPRIEWCFQVAAGPEAGQRLTQLSGTDPRSQMSTCYRIMRGMLGRPHLQSGDVFNPQDFVGKHFEVRWEINARSEAGRTHIASIREVSPPAPGAQVAPRTPPKPPAPPGAPAAPPPPAELSSPAPRYWVLNEKGQVENEPVPEQDVRVRVNAGETLQLKDEAQASEWKPAKEWGFAEEIPF